MTSRKDPSQSPQTPETKLLDGGWIVVPGNDDIEALSNAGPSERARVLRQKAAEIRKAVERMIDDEARRSLSGVADQYDALAGSIDRRRERFSTAADDD